MSARRKNVIWLQLDTLRSDFLGFGGCRPSPSPVLDACFAGGLAAVNAFSTGCPTQMAMPGFMTSTLPLDCGGYNLGIRDRPDTVAEVFQRHGYHTISLNPGRAGSLEGGYARGFARFGRYWGALGFLEHIKRFERHLYLAHESGQKSSAECAAILQPVLAEMFPAARDYAREKIAEIRDRRIGVSPNTAFTADECAEFLDVVTREEAAFSADQAGYIGDMVRRVRERGAPSRLLNFIRRLRGLPYLEAMPILRQTQRMEERCDARKRAIAAALPTAAPGLEMDASQFEFPSLGFLLDELGREIEAAGDRPFFAYLVSCDVHPEPNFVTYERHADRGVIGGELEAVAQFAREASARGASRDEVRYLASVRYVDLQVARLTAMLRARGLLDDTVLLLMSDHGTNAPGKPARINARATNSFYDEFFRIPLAYTGPGIGPRVHAGLCSALDVAPTLLGLVDLPSPASFKGASIVNAATPGRAHVFMEHMGAGICDFDDKPMTVAVRSLVCKVVYEMAGRRSPAPGFVRECYDLRRDPDEQENLAASAPALSEARPLIAAAEQRVAEIRAQLR